jgi:hypothetical protein
MKLVVISPEQLQTVHGGEDRRRFVPFPFTAHDRRPQADVRDFALVWKPQNFRGGGPRDVITEKQLDKQLDRPRTFRQ